MKLTAVLSTLALGTAVFAAPSKTIEKRADICGQYDSISTGSYIIYQDLWDEDDATSGSQCSGLDSLSDETISWYTSWTWEGGSSVKSFANVALDFTSEKLSSFSKIVATWSWSYSYSGTMVSDVAFDMFTSSSADGDSEYEIMVWLAAYGDAGPISSTGEAIHTVTLGGYAFKLYSGSNGDTTVYSFVAEETISDFYADLMTFFTYLIGEDLISSSQYLTTIEAGTEPTTGSDAELTSSYSCVIESS